MLGLGHYRDLIKKPKSYPHAHGLFKMFTVLRVVLRTDFFSCVRVTLMGEEDAGLVQTGLQSSIGALLHRLTLWRHISIPYSSCSPGGGDVINHRDVHPRL